MEKKILFVYTNFSTFVKTDYEILQEKFSVTKYQYKPAKGLYKNAIEFIKQFFFLFVNINRFDAIYIWFADYHSFLPIWFSRIFRKQTILVIGGYEVARMKKLNYGALINKFRAFLVIFSINHSTLSLAVSKHIEKKIKWIAPNAKTKLIYNCVKLPAIKSELISKENLVLTVAQISSDQHILIKGIDTFIETAKLMPLTRFMIIGADKLKVPSLKKLPKNVEVIQFIKQDKLIYYLKKAKVYCQLSRTESFGIALAEAMYYGCIPIVTNVGGLPEVIGYSGFLLKRDPTQIALTIKNLIDNKLIPSIQGKDRIDLLFHFNVRKKNLLNAITSID